MTRSVNDMRLRAQSLLQNILHGRDGSLNMSWMTPGVLLTAAVVIGVICIVLAVRGARKEKVSRSAHAEKPDASEKARYEEEPSWMDAGNTPFQKEEETADPYADALKNGPWLDDDADYAPYAFDVPAGASHENEEDGGTVNPYTAGIAGAAYEDDGGTVNPYAAGTVGAAYEDDERTVNPYAGGAAYEDDERTVNPYAGGAAYADDERTVNPYAGGAAYADDERTVNPYAGGAAYADDEQTVNPYEGGAAYADDERTVNPYEGGAAYEEDERTVNPYAGGAAYADDERTVNPYAGSARMQGRRRMPMMTMDDEETVNPYLTNWMPQMKVGFLLETQERQWKREIAFTGSMWIGGTEKCELELNEPDCANCCVELTHGGGNLYVRSVSRGGGTVYFNGEPLGDDLLPLQKGSELGIAGVRIRIERIDMAAFPG